MSERVDNGVTMSYNYDKQDRLTSESGSNANRTFTFNNTKLTRETVNTEGQISNENGATISLGKRKFTHDDNGNRVVENNADNETVAAYQYDPFNKLINTETANKEVSYSYRPDDLMLSKTATDGEKIYFIWHAGQIIAEIKGNGSVTNNYYYGLERIQSTKFGYYLHDAHGDVIGLANASGVATKSYSYDANGNEKNPSSSDLNPFRYCGEYFDGDTKLYYLRARWYDPSVGEFLTVDPARDGYNWYVYCENNPVKFVDSSGLYAIPAPFPILIPSPIPTHSSKHDPFVIPGSEIFDMPGSDQFDPYGIYHPYPYLSNSGNTEYITKNNSEKDKYDKFYFVGPKKVSILEARNKDSKKSDGKNTSGKIKSENNTNKTAKDIISDEKKGSINRVFPEQWKDKTLGEIQKAAKKGDRLAKTAKKLLEDHRFNKGDNRK